MVGLAANVIGEVWHNFYINWNLMYVFGSTKSFYICIRLKEYRHPTNLKQFATFTKSTLAMDNFKKSMRTRAQYAVFSGGVDWAARLALFRWINNGW